MKPIHKLNGGNGATLCNSCNAMISEGHTEQLFCDKCLDSGTFIRREGAYDRQHVLKFILKGQCDITGEEGPCVNIDMSGEEYGTLTISLDYLRDLAKEYQGEYIEKLIDKEMNENLGNK